MKKAVKFAVGMFAVLVMHCAQTEPDYEAPILVSPVTTETLSTTVFFAWNPNNKANDRTYDYSYTLQASNSESFAVVAFSCTVKVWNTCEASISAFRSGTVYWRVVGSYQGSIDRSWKSYTSETRTFTYDGNDGKVFVDPATTSTRNLGTQAHPVKTIAEAFSVAVQRKLTSIVIANNGSTYTETIPQYVGYTVKGCYDSTTWVRNTGACGTTFTDTTATTYYQINN